MYDMEVKLGNQRGLTEGRDIKGRLGTLVDMLSVHYMLA